MPLHGKVRFFAATLSFGNLSSFTAVDYRTVVAKWNACEFSLRRFTARHASSGTFWVEELAPTHFLPLKVQPHAHALIHSELEADEIDACLAEGIRAYRARAGGAVDVKPNVQVRPLDSVEIMAKAIEYMVKPIELSTGYAAKACEDPGPTLQRLGSVQEEIRLFVEGHRLITRMRHKINASGSLDPRAPNRFIGIPRVELRDQSKFVSEVLERVRAAKTQFPSG